MGYNKVVTSMTIDERLEKLAERHESLTHAVELLARMQGDSEARLAKHERLLTEIDERLAASQSESNKRFAEVHDIFNEVAQIQRQQASEILKHAKLLSEHDERMDRIGRHLEVLIDLVDSMIRREKK